IRALNAAVGDIVTVGTPLVEFAAEAAADSGAIVGELEKPEPKIPQPPPGPAGQVKAAPAVRALAKKLGVDLATVPPSGNRGEITRADVEKAAGSGDEWRPLRRLRRTMAKNMAIAGASVVPATVADEACVANWPVSTSVMARLVRALVAGCEAKAALNVWYDAERDSRLRHDTVNIGIAVDTADGLLVPVLRHAERLDLDGIEKALPGLVDSARSRSASPQTYQDATITLSNFGPVGGRFAALVVMPPQVAILGAGKIRPKPVIEAGNVTEKPYLPLSLSFDHRVVTGAEATRFLTVVIADLETPD
ncbi:MAG TPA: dihydrolipoamide acetyltransferase family protein, partial [Afifellaceae bacterium]|nr:dihydrolipoamide acetyltransferase family protein [Afifellaceae bacterium]